MELRIKKASHISETLRQKPWKFADKKRKHTLKQGYKSFKDQQITDSEVLFG